MELLSYPLAILKDWRHHSMYWGKILTKRAQTPDVDEAADRRIGQILR